jgi:transposase
VESTYNWYWLVDGLIEAGHSVHLANTVAIKQYDGLKYRGDESDARHLAHFLRLGLLPEGHIMPQPLRAVRDLSRKRMQLVQQRTTQLLSIGTCLAQQTGGQIGCDAIMRLTEADIDKMPIGGTEAIGVKANLAVMHALQTQIDGIEKALVMHCSDKPGYQQTRRWLDAGVFDGLTDDLRALLRQTHGREPEPTACVLDSRTLQSTPESGARAGFDAGKRSKGTKVHLAVDTLGHPLAVHAIAADEQDRAHVAPLLERVQDVTGGNVEEVYADQGYTGEDAAKAAETEGI